MVFLSKREKKEADELARLSVCQISAGPKAWKAWTVAPRALTTRLRSFEIHLEDVRWMMRLIIRCYDKLKWMRRFDGRGHGEDFQRMKSRKMEVKHEATWNLSAASGPFLAAVAILASSGSSSGSHVKFALVCGLVVVAPIASIIFTFVDPLTRESMECSPKAKQGNDRVNVSNASVKSCTGRRVPILCVTFFVVSVLAGGLIVPFFVLFFENDVHLSLVQVNLLEGCSWFFIAICSKAGAWISRHFGRALTMLSIFTLCTALTFMLRFGFPAPILVIVFLVRRGLGNCIKPLLDSVVRIPNLLMPKAQKRCCRNDEGLEAQAVSALWAEFQSSSGLLLLWDEQFQLAAMAGVVVDKLPGEENPGDGVLRICYLAVDPEQPVVTGRFGCTENYKQRWAGLLWDH
eukprot:s49_g62.t1